MLTILTPTYNRAYTLDKVYASLCRQTDYHFEWLLIDDGSTDGTEELVSGWLQQQNPFPIRYVRQENGGKHRAVNKGVQLAQGDFILILDSDDTLTQDAVACAYAWTETIKDQPMIAGVAGQRGKGTSGIPLGGRLQSFKYIDASNLERRRYGMLADHAEIFKTEVLRAYPFPEFAGEKFLRESASWDAMSRDGYVIRWYNHVIYCCDYLEDGLTKNAGLALYAKNIQGYTFCAKLYIETRSFPYTVFMMGKYAAVARTAGLSQKEARQRLGVGFLKMGFGKLLYRLNDCIKGRK